MLKNIVATGILFLAGSTIATLAQETFNGSVVDDIQEGYFNRTYKGKKFSDAGRVQKYSQGFLSSRWYIQIDVSPQGGARSRLVYCFIAADEHDPALDKTGAWINRGAMPFTEVIQHGDGVPGIE